MRWGLIARSERDRGLGIQTKAIFDNLKPDKTLVVVNEKSGFNAHPEDFPGSTVVDLNTSGVNYPLSERIVRDWMCGLDLVFSVETMYDWRIIEWARVGNVATLIQGNPEFWMETNPQPTAWTFPTEWRRDVLPASTLLPVPVPDFVPVRALQPDSEQIRLLHIAGNGAMKDRNGTGTLTLAVNGLQPRPKLTVYSQVALAPIAANVKPPAVDRWEMYRGQHVLVMPRKYGGLCLPALEAMACGLALVISDCSPNQAWPGFHVQTEPGAVVQMQTGPVQTYETQSSDLRNVLRGLTPHGVAAMQERSLEWAANNTWSKLAGRYYDLIDAVSASL